MSFTIVIKIDLFCFLFFKNWKRFVLFYRRKQFPIFSWYKSFLPLFQVSYSSECVSILPDLSIFSGPEKWWLGKTSKFIQPFILILLSFFLPHLAPHKHPIQRKTTKKEDVKAFSLFKPFNQKNTHSILQNYHCSTLPRIKPDRLELNRKQVKTERYFLFLIRILALLHSFLPSYILEWDGWKNKNRVRKMSSSSPTKKIKEEVPHPNERKRSLSFKPKNLFIQSYIFYFPLFHIFPTQISYIHAYSFFSPEILKETTNNQR